MYFLLIALYSISQQDTIFYLKELFSEWVKTKRCVVNVVWHQKVRELRLNDLKAGEDSYCV